MPFSQKEKQRTDYLLSRSLQLMPVVKGDIFTLRNDIKKEVGLEIKHAFNNGPPAYYKRNLLNDD